jgi:ABC-type transporter MlaC component
MKKLITTMLISLMVPSMVFSIADVDSNSKSSKNQGAQEFIKSMGDRVFTDIINKDGISADEIKRKFGDILTSDFDLATISSSVFPNFWRAASDADKLKCVTMLPGILNNLYADKFTAYKGYIFTVKSEIPMPNNLIQVKSELADPSGQTTAIDWTVLDQKNGKFLIERVNIEGVDFATNYLQSKYGDVKTIDELSKEANSADAS